MDASQFRAAFSDCIFISVDFEECRDHLGCPGAGPFGLFCQCLDQAEEDDPSQFCQCPDEDEQDDPSLFCQCPCQCSEQDDQDEEDSQDDQDDQGHEEEGWWILPSMASGRGRAWDLENLPRRSLAGVSAEDWDTDSWETVSGGSESQE